MTDQTNTLTGFTITAAPIGWSWRATWPAGPGAWMTEQGWSLWRRRAQRHAIAAYTAGRLQRLEADHLSPTAIEGDQPIDRIDSPAPPAPHRRFDDATHTGSHDATGVRKVCAEAHGEFGLCNLSQGHDGRHSAGGWTWPR